ncbi:MAG TPA: 3-isopropylmalate dehydratase small subunit [Alphaproteobacteria bacterium]|nr:3-isopropylmalate dehydratase small subunit [Alphaproteobacteria bacterium]
MEKFTKLTGIAAPLPMINVDTDKIIPARWLKTIKRTGLGSALFEAIRYTKDGAEDPDFVLNKPAYRKAQILVTGTNFGCGSSREHAVWALLDFGIRCVIAPDFADIFHNNAPKNGILCIKLAQATVDELMKDAEKGANARLTVDLEAEEITRPNGDKVPFRIDPFTRQCLLNGLDDIGLTLEKKPAIESFETAQKTKTPWLYA